MSRKTNVKPNRGPFGTMVYNARRAKDLTQHAMGQLVGVQQITVSNWEHGSTKPPSYALPAIASALGLKLDELKQAYFSKAVIPDADNQ